MRDEEQIRRTLAEFCVFLDERRFREWSELFIMVDVEGDEARASADLVMFDKFSDRPWFILTGTYTDHLVRDGGRWRFKNRQLALLAAGDA